MARAFPAICLESHDSPPFEKHKSHCVIRTYCYNLPMPYLHRPHEPPRRMSATELVRTDLPERASILDPILSTKSLALLYGPRGLGKTFFALAIAWAAASGTDFLGWRARRPHRVLYVDGEMAAVDMQKRLRLLGPPPPLLDFILADMQTALPPDLGDSAGQARLMESWGHPELVVLDNLSSLVGFRSGDPDAWKGLQRFLMLQRRFGRAMLLVHHANKSGMQRGTNRREDLLDLVMSMRRPAGYAPRQGARFEIHFEKARGLHGDAVDPIEARLEVDALGCARWSWQTIEGATLERAASLLNGGLKPTEMAHALGLSRASGYRLRQHALQRGLLDAHRQGGEP